MAAVSVECKQLPKVVAPIIDAHKCEGAGDCADVCPCDVFEVRKLTKAELKAPPFVPWLMVLIHGGNQGFVTAPDVCQACGLSVAACPEKAIRLIRLEQRT
jgi:NAD-dependent dihydropyrimidine dehydrogenase PreA subunit